MDYSCDVNRSCKKELGSTRCPWYRFDAHTACAPFNPLEYASMNRAERLAYLVSLKSGLIQDLEEV